MSNTTGERVELLALADDDLLDIWDTSELDDSIKDKSLQAITYANYVIGKIDLSVNNAFTAQSIGATTTFDFESKKFLKKTLALTQDTFFAVTGMPSGAVGTIMVINSSGSSWDISLGGYGHEGKAEPLTVNDGQRYEMSVIFDGTELTWTYSLKELYI